MITVKRTPWEIIRTLLAFSNTGIDSVDNFMYVGGKIVSTVFFAGILLLILFNPKIRQHKRLEERFMFWELILVMIQLAQWVMIDLAAAIPGYYWSNILMTLILWMEEVFFLLSIMQWMIFVDYSMYRSPDHIHRRHRFAILPIAVIMGLELFREFYLFGQFYLGATTVYLSDFQTYVLYISAYVKRALEIAYVLSAVYIVIKYKKESREPRFLRLSAFIVPFALGALIRDYVPIFLAAGILLTYIAVVKRDRYLDPDTGFYNRNFLNFLKTYRDRKQYYGGCAIRIDALEHKNEMAAILKEMSPVGSTLFALENDTFLLTTESMRPSAQKLLVMTFSEAAEESDTPFSPKITSMTLPELQL